MARMDTSLHIKFGQAYDLFGNKVDEKGNSYDNRGRILDRKKFVMSNGTITHNEQRDNEYTKELGYFIVKEYFKNNVVLTTSIFCFTLFNLLKRKYNGIDIYRILRLDPKETKISIEDLEKYIEIIKNKVLEMEAGIRISSDDKLKKFNSKEILSNAIYTLNNYYGNLVEKIHTYIILNDIKVIYYYSNRLLGYNLENYF
jgi:glycerol-3-phosphate O-acyltransferase